LTTRDQTRHNEKNGPHTSLYVWTDEHAQAIICVVLSSADTSHPPYPRRFGPYLLIEPLEHDPADQVSLAFVGDPGLEVPCVVQRLPRHLAEDKEILARFRDQTALVRRLSHGNLVATHAVGQIEREAFIAQEFIEGHDLDDVWARCSVEHMRVPVEVVLYIVSQVARGLAYAHAFEGLALVHGDISPAKIRLSYSGEVKLLGFGLTGCRSPAARPARPGEIAPIPRPREQSLYLAPEVLAGRPPDRRSDLYALGVILWELLTQRRFDPAVSPAAPSLVNPLLPVALDRIVAKALAPDPDARFHSADDMRETIGERLPSAFNIEWMLADLMAKLYDVRGERERRVTLIGAGAALRARRPTGQNALPPDAPPPATPLPVLVLPERPVSLPRRHLQFTRAQRYRVRVVASAAFALLSLATTTIIVAAIHYASGHPGARLEPQAASPTTPESADAASNVIARQRP
jgi:serine/threonine protein kinase